MKFYTFWEKAAAKASSPSGLACQLEAWGWSDESSQKAQAMADERLQGAMKRWQSGDLARSSYLYQERPLREEVLESFTVSGKLEAAVTRNRYGARVLNASGLMFIDVDVDPVEAAAPLPGFLRKILGMKELKSREDRIHDAITILRNWANRNPDWGFRVYETHSGLRYIATHAFIDPTDSATERIFKDLESDPLYITLCRTQQCFRARLTPKPWRLSMKLPPMRYVGKSLSESREMIQWIQDYEAKSQAVAVCKFLDTVGKDRIARELRSYIDMHDKETKSDSVLPLA